MRAPIRPRLADPDVERVARELADKIVELQKAPGSGLVILQNIELADGVETTIAHGLGRVPRWVRESCVRGASTTGRIDELRASNDRTKLLVLKASGFGATITIDLAVA